MEGEVYRWSVKILGQALAASTFGRASSVAYIFLDDAVISLEALMMRSRRSWCSSNSARKPSNMLMIGEELGAAVVSCSAMAACGRLTPIDEFWWSCPVIVQCYAGSCCCCLLALTFN